MYFFILQKLQELLDAEYHQKLEENKKLAEQVTAKKRAKRLKKKQGRKQKKQMKTTKGDDAVIDERYSEEDSSDENEEAGTAEIIKEHKNDRGNTQNSKDMSTVEDESVTTDKNQENLSKIPVDVTSENSQCENGT